MLTAGIDIGSRTSKGVILKGNEIVTHTICATSPDSRKSAITTMEKTLEGTGLSQGDLHYVVATGYGRVLVPFGDEVISEISCHAKGADWYFPSVRTILDMGGQDCKAISCDRGGKVTGFMMNDRCAGGTGRFLELIAEVLGVSLDNIGPLSLQSKRPVSISSTCALFAKSEVLSLLKKGVATEDILAGVHDGLTKRTVDLLRRISLENDFAITGGISKNIGMVARIRDQIGLEPLLAPEPVIIGAVGAALFAAERCVLKEREV